MKDQGFDAQIILFINTSTVGKEFKQETSQKDERVIYRKNKIIKPSGIIVSIYR